MYPIERQLGEYKRHVRNTRYLEGCIAEQYIVQECVAYYKLYTDSHVSEDARPPPTINFVSYHIKPLCHIRRKKLTLEQISIAHWEEMVNMNKHKTILISIGHGSIGNSLIVAMTFGLNTSVFSKLGILSSYCPYRLCWCFVT
ncbi:unnamed protein product [Rhodiola kirilowii]